jgi:hypothetical protein
MTARASLAWNVREPNRAGVIGTGSQSIAEVGGDQALSTSRVRACKRRAMRRRPRRPSEVKVIVYDAVCDLLGSEICQSSLMRRHLSFQSSSMSARSRVRPVAFLFRITSSRPMNGTSMSPKALRTVRALA